MGVVSRSSEYRNMVFSVFARYWVLRPQLAIKLRGILDEISFDAACNCYRVYRYTLRLCYRWWRNLGTNCGCEVCILVTRCSRWSLKTYTGSPRTRTSWWVSLKLVNIALMYRKSTFLVCTIILKLTTWYTSHSDDGQDDCQSWIRLDFLFITTVPCGR